MHIIMNSIKKTLLIAAILVAQYSPILQKCRIKKSFISKLVEPSHINIFYYIVLHYVLSCVLSPKNRLIETVIMSTHNICFGWEIRKLHVYLEAWYYATNRVPTK